MKSTQEREQERRREKLAAVDAQISSGSLVVRQMTAAERARYPPRPAPPKRVTPSAARRVRAPSRADAAQRPPA
jgi:hypothetical protein